MNLMKTTRNYRSLESTSRSRIAIMGALLVGFSTSLAAGQDEPSAADTAAARELAIDGLKLADAGHCAQAIDKLTRAEKIRHSPIVLGRLGECQIEEGKIVDGTEYLHRLLHESIPPNPPASLIKARERAQAVLDGAKSKIGALTIAVRGPTENVAVTVDGQPVPAVLLERDRPTDPGEHNIEATAPGYFKASRHILLSAGEKQEVTLKLRVDPQAVVTPAPTAAKPNDKSSTTGTPVPQSSLSTSVATEPNPSKESAPNYTPSTILWIAGGAVTVAGGVFGYLAMSDKSTLDSQCVSNSCPTSSKSTLDSANRYATVSTVLVGAGAAGLVLGTVLYFTAGPSSKVESPPTAFTPHAFVGLNRVGFEGTF